MIRSFALPRRVVGATLFGVLALMVLALAPSQAQAASPRGPIEPVKARLVAEQGAVSPGQTLWVALHLDIEKDWHVYWRNPGDSGLPTEIAWKLPPGFTAGGIEWPVPERFVTGDIGNYGYAGQADLLVPIKAPADLATGNTQHIEAHANWLVCSDICIPGEKTLALDLPAAAASSPVDPATAVLFAAARERLPKQGTVDARFAVSEKELRIVVPGSALAGLRDPSASFFPSDQNVIDAAAAPRQQKRGDGIELTLTRFAGPTAKAPDTLNGVLVLSGTGGERAYAVAIQKGAAPPPQSNEDASGWVEALLLAFLGGLVLNLMPCVFPVLSLKLLGLAEAVHRAEQRRHALAYAVGAVASFAVLGGVLLALREGGAAVGWGFQLQSPVVVALLAYLLFAMGLSLSGAADFGASLAGTGGRWAEHRGLGGAFATGVLATVVATPCTAPFMGTALGFALIAPAPVALAVFVALGCGLAVPIVIASLVPGAARLLPRPGPWMLWFKQLLAFPLYATVAWLIWVLLQEIRPDSAFLALMGLVAVGFAVWIYGRTRFAADTGRRLGAGLAAVGLAVALVIGSTLVPETAVPVKASAAGSGDEAFSSARLAGLEADHKRVFVNLTAAWCITCLVNERTTLDRGNIRRAFADHGVVVLKGDWTRQDPDITALLQKFGRSGVPLYLLYGRDGTPTVLPQILTEAMVLDALAKI